MLSRMRRALVVQAASLVTGGGVLFAQRPADTAIVVSAGFAADQYVAASAPIALTLSRMPAAAEGRLAVFVGTADLTSLFELVGSQLVFRSNCVYLPSGESELKVFLVAGSTWNELAKLPVRVRTPRGFEKALIDPGIELRNTGQLAEGHSGVQAAPARPTYQTVAATIGLQTSHVRDSLSLISDTHLLGANEQKDALQFALKGDQAPRIDLADYALRFQGRRMLVAAGQVTAGGNRHLINAFASRGVTAAVGGPRALLTISVEDGTSVVGTDNLLGIADRHHRILSSAFAVELFPTRPGALHLDATVLNGSLRPASGFNQSGVTAAERSDGYGVQLAASTPSQRVRFAAGLANSTSGFTAAPPANGGDSTPATVRHRKGARYAELNAGLLQGRKVFGTVPVTLNVGVRHERVDPMYRSVAVMTQSDIQRDGIDAAGNIDAIAVQVAEGWTADNLDAVASLLTMHSR